MVSDADMCDALGANGILRTYAFGLASGRPFFDRNCFPEEALTAEQYRDIAKSIFCHARYSPILTASALRWKKTQLAAAP